MNPFVQSAVARATPLFQWRKPRRAPAADCPRRKRHALRHSMSILLLSAGLAGVAPSAQAVDVNQASATQLESVRGIGPRTAEIIVRERERGGEFESLEDLSERVRGIGQKKAQALQAAGLTVGSQSGAAAPANPAAATKPAQAKPTGAKQPASNVPPARAKP